MNTFRTPRVAAVLLMGSRQSSLGEHENHLAKEGNVYAVVDERCRLRKSSSGVIVVVVMVMAAAAAAAIMIDLLSIPTTTTTTTTTTSTISMLPSGRASPGRSWRSKGGRGDSDGAPPPSRFGTQEASCDSSARKGSRAPAGGPQQRWAAALVAASRARLAVLHVP